MDLPDNIDENISIYSEHFTIHIDINDIISTDSTSYMPESSERTSEFIADMEDESTPHGTDDDSYIPKGRRGTRSKFETRSDGLKKRFSNKKRTRARRYDDQESEEESSSLSQVENEPEVNKVNPIIQDTPTNHQNLPFHPRSGSFYPDGYHGLSSHPYYSGLHDNINDDSILNSSMNFLPPHDYRPMHNLSMISPNDSQRLGGYPMSSAVSQNNDFNSNGNSGSSVNNYPLSNPNNSYMIPNNYSIPTSLLNSATSKPSLAGGPNVNEMNNYSGSMNDYGNSNVNGNYMNMMTDLNNNLYGNANSEPEFAVPPSVDMNNLNALPLSGMNHHDLNGIESSSMDNRDPNVSGNRKSDALQRYSRRFPNSEYNDSYSRISASPMPPLVIRDPPAKSNLRLSAHQSFMSMSPSFTAFERSSRYRVSKEDDSPSPSPPMEPINVKHERDSPESSRVRYSRYASQNSYSPLRPNHKNHSLYMTSRNPVSTRYDSSEEEDSSEDQDSSYISQRRKNQIKRYSYRNTSAPYKVPAAPPTRRINLNKLDYIRRKLMNTDPHSPSYAYYEKKLKDDSIYESDGDDLAWEERDSSYRRYAEKSPYFNPGHLNTNPLRRANRLESTYKHVPYSPSPRFPGMRSYMSSFSPYPKKTRRISSLINRNHRQSSLFALRNGSMNESIYDDSRVSSIYQRSPSFVDQETTRNGYTSIVDESRDPSASRLMNDFSEFCSPTISLVQNPYSTEEEGTSSYNRSSEPTTNSEDESDGTTTSAINRFTESSSARESDASTNDNSDDSSESDSYGKRSNSEVSSPVFSLPDLLKNYAELKEFEDMRDIDLNEDKKENQEKEAIKVKQEMLAGNEPVKKASPASKSEHEDELNESVFVLDPLDKENQEKKEEPGIKNERSPVIISLLSSSSNSEGQRVSVNSSIGPSESVASSGSLKEDDSSSSEEDSSFRPPFYLRSDALKYIPSSQPRSRRSSSYDSGSEEDAPSKKSTQESAKGSAREEKEDQPPLSKVILKPRARPTTRNIKHSRRVGTMAGESLNSPSRGAFPYASNAYSPSPYSMMYTSSATERKTPQQGRAVSVSPSLSSSFISSRLKPQDMPLRTPESLVPSSTKRPMISQDRLQRKN